MVNLSEIWVKVSFVNDTIVENTNWHLFVRLLHELVCLRTHGLVPDAMRRHLHLVEVEKKPVSRGVLILSRFRFR